MKYIAYDGNHWRVERLEKAAKIAAQILGLSLDQLHSLLWTIEDRKGSLCVQWKHHHTQTQMQAFTTAWDMCKEDGSRVFFFMDYNDFMIGGAE
jgi:hypothetical protein